MMNEQLHVIDKEKSFQERQIKAFYVKFLVQKSKTPRDRYLRKTVCWGTYSPRDLCPAGAEFILEGNTSLIEVRTEALNNLPTHPTLSHPGNFIYSSISKTFDQASVDPPWP